MQLPDRETVIDPGNDLGPGDEIKARMAQDHLEAHCREREESGE